jgi:hypothetical protein
MSRRIVLADDGIPFHGRSPEEGPLGGSESAFVSLAEGFAARGHEVLALTSSETPLDHKGVAWRPLAGPPPMQADLYIANRGDKLLPLVPSAKATAFWIQNPANYLLKRRYLWKIWRRQPTLIFLSRYHAATYPAWAPGHPGRIIPHAVDEVFRRVEPPAAPPLPRAAFTSNPLRSLDWILDLWVTRVRPVVPGAELHVFSDPGTYGAVGLRKADAMTPVLARTRALAAEGVVLRKPLPKAQLAQELAGFRALVYRGTRDETFCFAVAEAQAAGVPAVVCDIGSLAERVRHGVTGAVLADGDSDAFAAATVRLLADDGHWRAQHQGALAHQRGRSWIDVAAEFETLIEDRRQCA